MSTKRLAFIYPGQGSQHIGMTRDFFEGSKEWEFFLNEADQTLGRPLTQIMFDGPEEQLRDTANAQPALFLHEIIITRALEAAGYLPSIVAGHSVGEYAAITAAGVLDFGHGLWLVNQRGAVMSQAGQMSPGSMAAILGLDDAEVERCCAESGGNAVVANYNSPGQVVISGDRDSLDRAIAKCKEAGAKRALPLSVSGAFHSPLVKDANATLAQNMDRVIFRDATIPVITNVDGLPHTAGESIRANLLQQMESCVQWTRTMESLKKAEVDAIVEVGPGSVLSGLARRGGLGDIPVHQVGTLEQLRAFQP